MIKSIFTIKRLEFYFLSLLGAFLAISPLSALGEVTEQNEENFVEEEGGSNLFAGKISSDDILSERYIGFFVGSGKTLNKHIDSEGFANWGYPDSSSDYEDNQAVGGILIGKKNINNSPLRIEFDGMLGKISASTNQLDPKGLDETAKTEVLWLVTARAGLDKELGPATLFVNGGVALAQIRNSVTDMDYKPDGSLHFDPDDSFADDSVEVGWVIGLGAEFPISKNEEGWTLRLEKFHADFGEKTYKVNRSGNNRCGWEGPYRACNYNIDNDIRVFRLLVYRSF